MQGPSILAGGVWYGVTFAMSGGGWEATARPLHPPAGPSPEPVSATSATRESALRVLSEALRVAATPPPTAPPVCLN